MPVFVNDKEITDEEVFEEMQYHPAASAEEAMQMAARALAIRELLLQEVIAKGIKLKAEKAGGSASEEELITMLLESVIKLPETDEISVRRFYNNNLDKFRKDGKEIPFAEARPIIEEYLEDCSYQNAVQQYIKILAGNAKIAGVSIDAADSPLVN